jgi:hypothetical protein
VTIEYSKSRRSDALHVRTFDEERPGGISNIFELHSEYKVDNGDRRQLGNLRL